nr:oligosaccharide flippase family protein [uncultured Desulfobacter sp.]
MIKKLHTFFKSFLFSGDGSFLKKIFQGGTWLSLGLAATNLIGLFKAAVMVRFLKPEDFGLMGIAFVTLRWLEVLSESGFSAALIHKKGDISPYLNTAWGIQICRGTLLAALLFLFGNIIAKIAFSNEQAGIIIQATGLIAFVKSLINPAVIQLKKRLDLKVEFCWRLSGAIAGFIAGVVAAVMLKNVWALVLSVVISQTVVVVVSYWVYPFKPQFKISFRKTKELFGYGRSIFLANLFAFFREWADSLIVVKTCGLTSLGFYQISRQFSYDPSIQFGLGIRGVMFPAFSMLKNKTDIISTYFKSLKYISALMFPFAIVFTLYTDSIISLLMGSNWLPAAPTLKWLVWASIVLMLSGINHSCLAGIGKPQYSAIANGVSMLGLALFFLPTFRALHETGMAICIAITLIISFTVQISMVLKYLQVSISDFIAFNGLPIVCIIPFIVLIFFHTDLGVFQQVFFLIGAVIWMMLCIIHTIRKEIVIREKGAFHGS